MLFRRLLACLLLIVIGQAAMLHTGASAQEASLPRAASLAIVALPAEEARIVLRPGFIPGLEPAVGVGVLPDSRLAEVFWREASAGTPTASGARKGRACALRDSLGPGDIRTDFVVRPGASGDAIRRLLCSPQGGDQRFPESRVRVVAVSKAWEARFTVTELRAGNAYFPPIGPKFVETNRPPWLRSDADVLVIGTTDRTPILIGLLGRGRGTLEGIARRPGVVTPYDLTATILKRAGVPTLPDSLIGKSLIVRRDGNPLASVEALASRLERDADYGPAVAGATIAVMAGGGVIFPMVFLLLLLAGVRWTPRAALRAARGGAAAVTGYVMSLFIPTGNAGIRSIPIVLAYALGALLPIRDAPAERRRIGILLAAAAALIATLTVAAAAHPGGEPALSLWGNPLVSWRLFGLRNHLTSMLALGAIAGVATGLARPSARQAGFAGAAGVFIAGAAFLGANFVAVLTLTFGVALVTWILATNRVSVAAITVSMLLAMVAFAVALLADSGSPVSHGGRAVEQVRAGGFDAAVEFLRIRWRLSIDLINGIWGGWVWTAGLVAGLVAIVVWSARGRSLAPGSRAAMFGGAACALAALVTEDTGFLAGGIIALAPALIATTELADRLRPLRASSSAAGREGTRSPEG